MRTSLRSLLALCLLVPVAALVAGPADAASSDNRPTFIVTLRSGEPREVANEHARRYGADIEFVYEHALRGYAAQVSNGQIGELARDGRVARIERDAPVHAQETVQTGATWGIDRVDQRTGTDGTYTYGATGSGVTAYIIDTGIRNSHRDLGGRARSGYDAIDGDSIADDCNGHGTHVAGTVGGATHGVAKAVTLVGVRVLDCAGNGSWAGVIAGIDWVTGHHAPGQPAVANMSLGGGVSSTVDAAVQRSIDDGVSYAIAAGNGNLLGIAQNACNYSPARVPAAMTIGATTSSDTKSSFSNYGSCVDWFAPGSNITSAWYTSDTATNTISGTSMATPHVAGAAALYLQDHTAASPLTVRNALYDAATKGIVTSSSTANNHLLYTAPTTSTPDTNVAPAASFTRSCTGLSCSFADTSTDPDGTIASRSWSFGDGASSTAQNPSHTYATAGTYTVTLTVTDDAGAANSTSQSVTVTAPSGGLSLSARGYKVKGAQQVDLTWSGATAGSVDILRNGTKATTTVNDGAHVDTIGTKGGGSYTYQVCNAGSSTCSNEVTVTF